MELWTAFMIGLVGSLHCAGMCGPLALALPVTGRTRAWSQFQAMGLARRVMAQFPEMNQKVNEALAAGGLSYQPGRVTVRHMLDVIVDDLGETAVRVASAKAALSVGEAFARGVLCNALVCLAVWLAMGGRSVTGRATAPASAMDAW